MLGILPGINNPPAKIRDIVKNTSVSFPNEGIISMLAKVALSNTADREFIQYKAYLESLVIVCAAKGFKPSPSQISAATNKYTFPARIKMVL